MKKAKQSLPDKDGDTFINLERVSAENVAEISSTLDRIRTSTQKLTEYLAERSEALAKGEIKEWNFEESVQRVEKALKAFALSQKIILESGLGKQKLHGGK